jgi:hypothetical protein
LPFTPKYVSLDFEHGAILAFIHCFPGIFIIGCWFHYAQCIYKKITELGLKKAYKDDEELRNLVQNCIALALCYHKDDNNSEIIDIFIEFVINKSVAITSKYPRFGEFIEYMNKTWIEGEDEEKGPLFKIIWWNHWYHMENRTNNTNEAYNFRITIKLGNKPHPNIWVWIEFIQGEDFQMSVKVESMIQGKYLARSRREEDRKDLTILNAKFKYVEGGRIGVAELLEKFRDLCPKANF